MNKPLNRFILIVLLALLLITTSFIPTQAQEGEDQPVVRAVLFYSPACGHCENVIQNELPPLLDHYRDQLKIVAINTLIPEGQEIYMSTVEYFKIPDERVGVPTLVVADIVMVGGEEIPVEFPGIIADGLEKGGVDWPQIPGLNEVIAGVQFSSEPTGTIKMGDQDVSVRNRSSLSMFDKFKLDPIANTIAILTLIVMILSIIWVAISFTRPLPEKDFWPRWIIPILAVLGMGVAFYLTYVETSGVEAVCGPVGDCNTVQLSPYAVLFGILPVGLLGLIGYALTLTGWAIFSFGPQSFRWASAIAVWGMAFFGVLFS
ncbi:vitamin K epoxide reductase family protein, partial [Chloroflexota bacterium]